MCELLRTHPLFAPPSIAQHIESETGASLKLAKTGGGITVTGTQAEVSAARALVAALCEGNTPKVLMVPRRDLPRIIGTKGAVIREMQQQSGARITIDRDDDRGDDSGDDVQFLAVAQSADSDDDVSA